MNFPELLMFLIQHVLHSTSCACMNELFIPLHFLKLFPLIWWIYPLTWSLRSIKEYLGPSEKRSHWSLIFFWRGIKQVWKINCVITIEWCWNLAVSCGVIVSMAWWFSPLVRDAAYLHGYRCLPLPCHPQTIPARLLFPWDSPGQNTGVGSHSLLQGMFLTQG